MIERCAGLLLALFLAGCAHGTGHFVERPSENVDSPRVRIMNETPGEIYVTLKSTRRHDDEDDDEEFEVYEDKIEVLPWSYSIHELPSGVYDYQIFIQGRLDMPAKWFRHGPIGHLHLLQGHRYGWRWRPRPTDPKDY